MKTSTFRRKLSAVRAAERKSDYAKALAALDALIEEVPGNASLLVRRAMLIQLLEEGGPPLGEAKRTLQSALELDEKHPAALIELAQFQFAVEDDAAAATKTFQSAVGACSRLLMEALLGQAKALVETNRREEAFDCLAQVRWLQASGVNGYAAPLDADDRELVERWEELAGISY
jgi:predicted Zn-dependent protease